MNGYQLLGLNHVDVVVILKELPQHVRIVCARKLDSPDTLASEDEEAGNEVRRGGYVGRRLGKLDSPDTLTSENEEVGNEVRRGG